MKKIVYGIYGASGFGKEVLPLVRDYVLNSGGNKENIFLIDDAPEHDEYLNHHKVLSFDDFLAIHSDEYYVSIAIANSTIRETLTNKCHENGIKLLDVKANNIVVLDDVAMGEGSILCPFVTLTSSIKIGKSFQANIYSYVAHDCIIGDYVTFSPGVKCNGNVVIEDHAYIGTGAIIHQGKPNKPLIIGEGAVIAAGSIVTKSVPAGMTVFGNPAIEFTKENMKRRR
jgi:sugar O-acyltransferase (sialic acid O-acetyltransferase NeuD family)